MNKELVNFKKMNKTAREKKAVKMGFANAVAVIAYLEGKSSAPKAAAANKTELKKDVVTAPKVVAEDVPATRTVKLVYEYCCGCGCWDIDLERVVPFNSPLKDGDRIQQENVKSSDIRI